MENKELTDKPNVMLIVCKPNAVLISLELHKEIELKKPEIDTMGKIGIVRKLLPGILSSIISICANSHNRESAKSIIAADFVNYSIEFKRVLLVETLNCLNTHSLKGSEAYNELVNQLQEGEKNNKLDSIEKIAISLNWQSSKYIDLKEFFRLVKFEYCLISDDELESNFINAFSRVPAIDLTPITWVVSNKLIAYLFENLFPNENWQNTIGKGGFFKNKKGKILLANDLAQGKRDNLGKPKGYEKIDNLVKAIKNIHSPS